MLSILTPFGRWVDDRQQAIEGMSDSELARQVGLSRQQIWAIKKGQSRTKIEVVKEIAAKLNSDEDEALRVWALGDKADMRADVEITRIVYSLRPEQRPALVRAIRSLAEVLSI